MTSIKIMLEKVLVNLTFRPMRFRHRSMNCYFPNKL